MDLFISKRYRSSDSPGMPFGIVWGNWIYTIRGYDWADKLFQEANPNTLSNTKAFDMHRRTVKNYLIVQRSGITSRVIKKTLSSKSIEVYLVVTPNSSQMSLSNLNNTYIFLRLVANYFYLRLIIIHQIISFIQQIFINSFISCL